MGRYGKSSRESAAGAGWGAEGYPRNGPVAVPGSWMGGLAERRKPKWDSFSWLTVRALFESVNDLFAKLRPEIVEERRARWVSGQRGRCPTGAGDLVFKPPREGESVERAFFLVGDTGEQDASQYAVIPYLTAEATQSDPDGDAREPEFMTIVSDVIYPAGDINEYVNGFYIPYQDFEKPIYALPGNHDWYDGLDGFMYHFCGAEPLPTEHFRRTQVRPAARLASYLWRGAEAPNRQELGSWRQSRHWGRDATDAVQPGPYFAIDLDDLLLVAIDTGVTGTIDEEQGLWLVKVSEETRQQKILLTGKPIYVDGEYKPCAISWNSSPDRGDEEDPRRFATVDDVVRHEPFGYLAAIGGDVHNYQRYPIRIENQERTIHYLVSGGGGAYLSPTHRIPPLGEEPTRELRGRDIVQLPADADRYVRPDEEDPELTFRCYPQRGDSVAYSARRGGPRIFNAVQVAAAAFVGAASLLLYAVPLPTTSRSALATVYAVLPAVAALVYLCASKLSAPKKVPGLTIAAIGAVALFAGAAWIADLTSHSDLLTSARFWSGAGVVLLVPLLLIASIPLAHDLRGSVPAALPQLALIGAFLAAALLWLPSPALGSAPSWLVDTVCAAAAGALSLLLLGLARQAWQKEEENPNEPLAGGAFAYRLFDSALVVAAPATLAVALEAQAGGDWVGWLAVSIVGAGALPYAIALATRTFAPSRLAGKRLTATRVAAIAVFLSTAAWVTVAVLLLHMIGDGWIAAAAVGSIASLTLLLVAALLLLLIVGTVLLKRVIVSVLLVATLIAARYVDLLPFVPVALLLLITAPAGVWGIRKGRINADAAQTEIRTKLRGGEPPAEGTARKGDLNDSKRLKVLNAEKTLFKLFYPYRWKLEEGREVNGIGAFRQVATELIAELGDSDEPPFFKHLLRVDVRGRQPEAGQPNRELTIRCFGITGFADGEREPPLEDEISIPFFSRDSLPTRFGGG
jgi:hypothetical protein